MAAGFTFVIEIHSTDRLEKSKYYLADILDLFYASNTERYKMSQSSRVDCDCIEHVPNIISLGPSPV